MKISIPFERFARRQTWPRSCQNASRRFWMPIGAAIAAVFLSHCGLNAQVLLQDTFVLGPRPMGSSGTIQTALVDTGLNDFWAAAPNLSSARWVAPIGPQVPTWTFATAPVDLNEPPVGPPNGCLQGQGHAAALLPFAPPPGSFRIAAEVTPINGSSDWVALGFTSAGAVSDNFVSFGRLWMRLDGQGHYAVLSYDVLANTNLIRVSGTTALTGFNALQLAYDPATGMVSGSVNGVKFPPFLTFSASGIAFAGVEAHNAGAGAQVVDYFRVEGLPPTGPRSELFVASKSEQGGGKTQLDVLQGPADQRTWFTKHGSELALAVNDTVRMVGLLNLPAPGDKAAEYTLAGVYTGTDYPFPVNSSIPMQLLDGTTDGVHNYAWDFNNNEAWQFDLNWAKPVKLFSLGAPSVTGTNRAGITYDPSNNSLWLSGYTNNVGTGFIENRALDGTLLSSFITPHVRNRSLALDPADGTLWVSSLDLLGSLQNYARTGAYLGGHYYPELVGVNVLGAEFRSVPAPPLIEQPPQSQTVDEGASVTFTVAVFGTAPFHYQWQKDSVEIAGATNSVLTLSGVTAAQAGSYFVIVGNVVGSVTSAGATLAIAVPPVNHPPVATGQTVTTVEDTAVGFTLGGTDIDGDPLTFAVVTGPAHGTLTGTPPAATYTPAANYNGPDSFTFTAHDGVSTSAPATIALTVTPVNDAPLVANPLGSPATTTYGAAFTFQFPADAFSDPDNDPLTYTASGMPAGITFGGATRTFSGAATQVGAFPVAVVALDNGTPNLSDTNLFTITVNPAAITGDFTAADKVYDGSTNATVLTRTLSGVLAADTGNVSLTGGTASFANATVGTGKTVSLTRATLAGTAAGNYILSSVGTATANITALGITGGFTAADKAYDGTTSATALTRTLSGVLAADTSNVSLTGGTASFANATVGADKTVTLTEATLAGTAAGNYTLSSVGTATASITALGITGSFTAADKVYDGTTNATVLTLTLNGVLAADTGNVSLTGGTASFANATVGTGKTVTLTGATLAGTAADNYTLSSVGTATASITAATLLISADDKTKVVGAADPAFTATYAGLVNGETTNVLSGSLSWTREPGEDVGSYAITPSGPTNANYAVIFVPGTLTITAAAAGPVMFPLTFSGTDVVIAWSAVSNATYRVQYKTGLSAADWTDLPGDVTATGTTASKTDLGTSYYRFYRVQVLP